MVPTDIFLCAGTTNISLCPVPSSGLRASFAWLPFIKTTSKPNLPETPRISRKEFDYIAGLELPLRTIEAEWGPSR